MALVSSSTPNKFRELLGLTEVSWFLVLVLAQMPMSL